MQTGFESQSNLWIRFQTQSIERFEVHHLRKRCFIFDFGVGQMDSEKVRGTVSSSEKSVVSSHTLWSVCI